MKRSSFILKSLLFAFLALYPLGYWLLSECGYTLTLFSVPVFSIAMAVVAVCIVVLDHVCQCTVTSRVICFLMALIAPLSVVNTFLCLLEDPQVSLLVSGIVCFACCCFLTVKYGKPIALKIVALVLSAILVMPTGLLSLLAVFFPIGQNTVVQTLESPTGKYYAEVVDSDQGALGGDTLVNVYEQWEIDLLLFKIEKKPQLVYFGEWGEYKNMKIYWENDHCIVIHSTAYEIE